MHRFIPVSTLRRGFSTSTSSEIPLIGQALLVTAVSAVAGGSYLFSDQIRRTSLYLKVSDSIVVPLLRFMDAEDAHNYTIMAAKYKLTPMEKPRPRNCQEITDNIYAKRRLKIEEAAQQQMNFVAPPSSTSRRLETKVWGKTFPNPIGMAAGFDKHAEIMGPLLDLGFGFVEVGGVTPFPQNGNSKPRSFRLTEDQAIINRYGLNSHGAEAVCKRLYDFKALLQENIQKKMQINAQGCRRTQGIIGVNLAKNTETKQTAKEDYSLGVQALGPHVDFIVMNISCPNVGWTSKLKDSEISELIVEVIETRNTHCSQIPVLLKIGPDYDDEKIKSIVQVATNTKVDGIIVSNTSKARPDSLISSHRHEAGGLSGQPIKDRAMLTLQKVYALTKGKIPLIGVGGIATGEDVYQRIRAGASLVEVYTAMTYGGASLVQDMKLELDQCLLRDGFQNVSEAVGADYRK